ncbi:hypothetical protein EYF80_046100 [Liparis tanakae]|uniref:Uncharacterized protein n=1 Tax=Liparis tanakae TaxID=230148 RepID=A0A4Z2FR44_9TELE|nr:hypothetical protein EYF80_046100 [Liparis tanakae]
MPGMMDKGSEYLGKGRSNGTKSPSNASNGHFSDESGSDDEHGDNTSPAHLHTASISHDMRAGTPEPPRNTGPPLGSHPWTEGSTLAIIHVKHRIKL